MTTHRRLKAIDFLHINDARIFSLFGFKDKAKRIGHLPFSIRRRYDSIRSYIWTFSRELASKEEEKSIFLLHKIRVENNKERVSVHNFKCFGLTLKKLLVEAGIALDSDYKHKIIKGFGIRKQTSFL